MIKVGIVGVRGLSTMAGFAGDPRSQVVAFCDLDEQLLEREAARHGVPKTYRVFEDMLDADLDAIVVATPMQLHTQQVIAALQAGKHVLSEVPAAVSLDELWWLIEAVEGSGRVYMMAENYLYIPQVQQIAAMVRAGLFGEVYYGEGEYLHNLNSIVDAVSYKNLWRKHWQLGRRGLFYPTHSLGPVMKWFVGDRVTEVCCLGTGSHTRPEFRQDDTSITLCRTAGERLIKLRLDCLSQRPHNLAYYALQGTAGCYEGPRGLGDDHKVWLGQGQPYRDDAAFAPLADWAGYLPERYQNATEEQRRAGHWGGDYFIVQDFLDAVAGVAPPAVDVYEACEWTAVGLLAELSAQNHGRMMTMPHFRKHMPREEMGLKL
ncbi:MAG: Gfo/Idh/MocA family protein [Christensenellales bacterium]|jgi:predicted dehydrogenase